MPEVSVITTIITAAGTLGGALGGISLTTWAAARREERQAIRQRKEAHAMARSQAYADLLGASAQLRAHVEITCHRHWKDLNVRLSTAQAYAVDVGLQASRTALLSSGQLAQAALDLGKAASALSAWVAKNAEVGDFGGPGDQFLPGQVVTKPDFREFDARADAFFRLEATALHPGTATTGTQIVAGAAKSAPVTAPKSDLA
jgi:hypothetical protein